jgi:hypothetical protein
MSGMLKAVFISMILLALGTGCATNVYQPRQTLAKPATVYIADYGIHSSLLLPNGDGRYVEYAFGDWNFAALNHCWPNDALGALLISFQSALGRRFIEVRPGQTVPCPCHPMPHQIQAVHASADEVAKVVKELDTRYHRDDTVALFNPDNNMTYVKDSEHYSVANNCNHLTARCLRKMGCEVHGFVVLSTFKVIPMEAQTIVPPIRTAALPATMPSASAN